MAQVIIFFISIFVLIENGVGFIGAFLGSVAISFVGSFILLGVILMFQEDDSGSS